MKKIINLVT